MIGVPTVTRQKGSYLIQTLHGLVDALNEHEKKEVIIVVMVTDLEPTSIISTAGQINSSFSNEMNSGLIRVVQPPRSFYPNMDNLPELYGDKPDRVRWRSKQCLDYAFLMGYCKDLGRYYLQIEDDVLTSTDFLKKIKSFISIHKDKHWSVLEFGARGSSE